MDPSSYTLRQVGKSVSRVRQGYTGGHGKRESTMLESAIRRGGTAPFNLIPLSNARGHTSAGAHGHGAGTPIALARWWVRYICPPGGTVLDPFGGSGTTAVAALTEGRSCVLVEKEAAYVEIARRRIAEAEAAAPLFAEASR